MQIDRRDGPSTPFPQVVLPPGHFLSLPPSFAESTSSFPSGSPSTSSHASNGLAPNIASLASADFEVDVRTGFLPATKNVGRLEGRYMIWEEALDAARGEGPGDGLIVGGQREREMQWRQGIQSVSICWPRCSYLES